MNATESKTAADAQDVSRSEFPSNGVNTAASVAESDGATALRAAQDQRNYFMREACKNLDEVERLHASLAEFAASLKAVSLALLHTSPTGAARFDLNRARDLLARHALRTATEDSQMTTTESVQQATGTDATKQEVARLRSQVDTLRGALERIAGGDVMGPDNWTHADTVMAYQRIAGAALSTIKEPR